MSGDFGEYEAGEYDDVDLGGEELLASSTVPGDSELDASLRPRTLSEFIGQAKVREQLELVLHAARNRGRTPDHILLSGPPGLGKTSLAMIITASRGPRS